MFFMQPAFSLGLQLAEGVQEMKLQLQQEHQSAKLAQLGLLQPGCLLESSETHILNACRRSMQEVSAGDKLGPRCRKLVQEISQDVNAGGQCRR